MLGSVNPHSRKNGTYILYVSNMRLKARAIILETFTVKEYGTAAKAKAAADSIVEKKMQSDFKRNIKRKNWNKLCR